MDAIKDLEEENQSLRKRLATSQKETQELRTVFWRQYERAERFRSFFQISITVLLVVSMGIGMLFYRVYKTF